MNKSLFWKKGLFSNKHIYLKTCRYFIYHGGYTEKEEKHLDLLRLAGPLELHLCGRFGPSKMTLKNGPSKCRFNKIAYKTSVIDPM